MLSTVFLSCAIGAFSVTGAMASALHTPIAPYGNPMVEGVAYVQQSPFGVNVVSKSALIASKLGPTGGVFFVMQADGNFCAYQPGQPYGSYCSETNSPCSDVPGGCRFAWQADGRACVWVGKPEKYGYCTDTMNTTAGAANSLVMTGLPPYFSIYSADGTLLDNTFYSVYD